MKWFHCIQKTTTTTKKNNNSNVENKFIGLCWVFVSCIQLEIEKDVELYVFHTVSFARGCNSLFIQSPFVPLYFCYNIMHTYFCLGSSPFFLLCITFTRLFVIFCREVFFSSIYSSVLCITVFFVVVALFVITNETWHRNKKKIKKFNFLWCFFC